MHGGARAGAGVVLDRRRIHVFHGGRSLGIGCRERPKYLPGLDAGIQQAFMKLHAGSPAA
jgi:hypothetical protein